jgi:quercetin dioxygenase-like cupin family protein
MIALLLALCTQAEASASTADARAIQKALAVYAGDVHGCYARALAPDDKTAGEVLVRLTMGEGDRVARAEILKDQVGSPVLTSCLQERMLAWNLPGLGAPGTQLVFPLAFQSGPATPHTVKLADVAPVPPTPATAPGKSAKLLPLQTWLLLDEKSVGASKAALAVVQVGAKAKVALHRHPAAAEILYVLEGHGRLLVPGAEPEKLDPGTAVYLKPGVVHSIDDQSSQKPLRFLQAFAPPGPERVLRDRTKAAGTEVVKGAAPPAPAGSYKIVHEADVAPFTPTRKLKVHILLEPESTSDPAAYLGVLEADAGAEVAPHKHPGSAELIYIVSGSGKATVAGQTSALEEGTAIYIPEDSEHSASFDAAARAVQLYAPAGPEQRFKAKPAGPAR